MKHFGTDTLDNMPERYILMLLSLKYLPVFIYLHIHNCWFHMSDHGKLAYSITKSFDRLLYFDFL